MNTATFNARQEIAALLDEFATTGQTTSTGHVVRELLARTDRADLEAYASRHLEQHLRREASAIIRDQEDSNQLSFDGIEWPKWYAHPDGEGGIVHTPLISATLDHFRARLAIKAINVVRAQTIIRDETAKLSMLESIPTATGDSLLVDLIAELATQP